MAVPWPPQLPKAIFVLALCVPIVGAIVFLILPIASVLAWFRDTSILASDNLLPAVLCALIACLFVVVFHVKKETILVPFKNRQDFLAACHLILKDLGYEVAQKEDDGLVSWPSFRALLLGGHIHIQPRAHESRITGPKVFVEILRTRLRLHSHITGFEQTMRDSRGRQADRLIKRVEISMRLTPAQWNEAGDAVVKKLLAAGAEIFCEVHLLAHSTEGIREAIVDGSVREWLQKKHIPAEIHKDHSRFEPAPPRDAVEDTVVVQEGKFLSA